MSQTKKAIEILKDLTILCVEDEDGVRDSLVEYLNKRFKTVYAAFNGEDGLEKYNQDHPDIIITDIQMPVMNGLEMSRIIRETDKDIPIIIVSAFNDISYLREAIEIGVGSYVSKPVDGRKMTETLLKSAQRIKYHSTLSQLNESQQLINMVAEHSPSGICVYGEKILFANDAMQKITEIPAEELVQTDVRDTFLADISVPDSENESEARGAHFEIAYKTRSGEKKYLDITVSPLRYEGEDVTIANVNDITERKWFEKELERKNRIQKELNEELKHNLILIEEKNRELATQLYTDTLTGLPNRFKLTLDIQNSTKPLLILLNLDSFKEINDFYGDKIGDFVLNEIAKRLKNYEHHGNITLYKMQADEYAFFSPECDNIDFLDDLMREVHNDIDTQLLYVRDQEIHLRITGGIDYGDKEFLLSHTDIALKRAKKFRRPYLLYDESMMVLKEYEQNFNWMRMLKEAMSNHRIIPYFQPILDNKTGEITKFECLARLIDANGEVYTPHYFLNIAKQARLYTQITKAVVLDAFKIFSKLPYGFTVNLSIEDIQNEETVSFIMHQLREHGEISHRVVFEILESEGINNYDEVADFIREIKQLGAQVAIDDFGSGYSNFSHILGLDVDFLKIDGSIVKNIESDENSRIICQALVDFAKRLDIQTVAEFVKSEGVHTLVKEFGVDYSQGFHLGEPSRHIKKEG